MCPHPAHLLTLMSAVNGPIPLLQPRLALKCTLLCLGPVPRPDQGCRLACTFRHFAHVDKSRQNT